MERQSINHTRPGLPFRNAGVARFALLFLVALLLPALLLSTAGCNKGEYDAQLSQTLDAARDAEPFLRLWEDETALLDGQLTLRLPQLFDKSRNSAALDADSPDPRDETLPLDPYRLQPHFLELPGHVRTYERFMQYSQPKAGKNTVPRVFQWPVYCIVSVSDVIGDSATDDVTEKEALKEAEQAFRADLVETLKAEFGDRRRSMSSSPVDLIKGLQVGAEPAWKLVNLPTPAGTKVEWHRIEATGSQSFHSYGSGDDEGVVKASEFRGDCYLFHRAFDVPASADDLASKGAKQSADAKQTVRKNVVLAIRAPVALSRRDQFNKLAAAVAGTIEMHAVSATLEEDESADEE